jgi:hypothetical protein
LDHRSANFKPIRLQQPSELTAVTSSRLQIFDISSGQIWQPLISNSSARNKSGEEIERHSVKFRNVTELR